MNVVFCFMDLYFFLEVQLELLGPLQYEKSVTAPKNTIAIATALYDFDLLLLMQIEFTNANLRIFGS